MSNDRQQSSLPTQTAWAGVYLLYLVLASRVPETHQAIVMHGGLCGLLAGVGLEQARKRVQMTLQCASSIRQHILLQTRGRIHDLDVRVSGRRACIEGYAASYSLMQLARSAALDVLGCNNGVDLDFNIRVRKARRPA